MRRAYNEFGFTLNDATGQLEGFNLGFDFCAEHERGFEYLTRALGLPALELPQGIEDRTATQVPPFLQLREFTLRPRDRRFKKTMPAAVLFCGEPYQQRIELLDSNPEQFCQTVDAGLLFDPTTKSSSYGPAQGEVASSWSSRSGFTIAVRGERNITLLRELHAAFLNKDIAYGSGVSSGFKRTSAALVIASRISQETREHVLARDQAYRKIKQGSIATPASASAA